VAMEISVFGANFRSAPLELRERLALNAQGVSGLLRAIRAEGIFSEAVVLSTCNRTEVYYAGTQDGGGVPHMLEHLGEIKGVGPPSSQAGGFYRYSGEAAVRHVFSVAASLDSQVVGEHEIIGQVKEAYRLAVEEHTAQFLMRKLMHAAFRTGKRVRTETALGRGAAGVPQAAVGLAQKVLGTLAGKCVLLVGAGTAAELVAGALIRAGATRLIVANRTFARAGELAQGLLSLAAEKAEVVDADCDRCLHRQRFACRAYAPGPGKCPLRDKVPALAVEAVEMSQLASAVGRADLVISSTCAERPVLTAAGLGGALEQAGRCVLMIDIAMPRDIEPALGAIANVRLYNIDDLEAAVLAGVQRRLAEVPAARTIVEEEVARFCRWLRSLSVLPTVKLLRQRSENLVQRELRRYGGKLSMGSSQDLEAFAQGLCRKVLHQPLAFLRELSQEGEESSKLESLDLLRRMFKLDGKENDEPGNSGG